MPLLFKGRKKPAATAATTAPQGPSKADLVAQARSLGVRGAAMHWKRETLERHIKEKIDGT